MAGKSKRGEDGLLRWLYQVGEDALGQAVEEVIGNRAFTDAVGKAVHRAAKTKGRMDKNVQTLLGLLNLPSRADYQRLLTKVETLQGSLLNVNMKLDRLLAAQQPKPPPRRPPRPDRQAP